MTEDLIDLSAWRHALREQLAEASGVPDAGTAPLDPAVDAALLADVPDDELLRAREDGGRGDDAEARALSAEIGRRGLRA